MIKLVGEKLWQYDLDRTVEITPANGRTVEAVRFVRGRRPYVLAHREEGGKIIADIPNVLLKSFGAISCIVDYVDEDGHIVNEKQSFYVNKRDIPEGYVYTETDTLELGEGGSGDSNVFIVNISYVGNQTWVADKTFEEIWEASKTKACFASQFREEGNAEHCLYPLSYVANYLELYPESDPVYSFALFASMAVYDNEVNHVSGWYIYSDNTVKNQWIDFNI